MRDIDPKDYTRPGRKVDVDLDALPPVTGWGELPCDFPGYTKLQNKRTGAVRIVPKGHELPLVSPWA